MVDVLIGEEDSDPDEQEIDDYLDKLEVDGDADDSEESEEDFNA